MSELPVQGLRKRATFAATYGFSALKNQHTISNMADQKGVEKIQDLLNMSVENGERRMNVNSYERIASIVGGSALAIWGLRRFSTSSLLATVTGGMLVYRGLTGHSPVYEQAGIDTMTEQTAKPVRVEAAVTVDQSREQVYEYWRNLENLPRFMRHLTSVKQTGEETSHWEASVTGGMSSVQWEAEITEDEPGERIAWRSLPDATIQNSGVVDFEDAPGDRGTEIRAIIEYRPPAGDLGASVARFFTPALEQMIKEDVRRFKHVVEAGEIPTTEGQPTSE